VFQPLIDAGASIVNNAINEIKHELANSRRDQNENNNLVQHQVAAIHIDMENQTNAVAQIGNQLKQFAHTLLAGHDEKAIEGKIHALDNNIAFKTQCLWCQEDPVKQTVINSYIGKLQNERRFLTKSLNDMADITLSQIGPAPGIILPNPSKNSLSQAPRPSCWTSSRFPSLTLVLCWSRLFSRCSRCLGSRTGCNNCNLMLYL